MHVMVLGPGSGVTIPTKPRGWVSWSGEKSRHLGHCAIGHIRRSYASTNFRACRSHPHPLSERSAEVFRWSDSSGSRLPLPSKKCTLLGQLLGQRVKVDKIFIQHQ